MDTIEADVVSGSPLASLPDPSTSEQAALPGSGLPFSWRTLLGLVGGLLLGLALLPLFRRRRD